jgi:hypothetical protein
LGVGTNAPFEMMQIGSTTNRGTLNIVNDALSPFIRMSGANSGNNQSTIIGDGNGALDFKFNGTTTLYLDYQNNVSINTARLALGAKLGVRGSGSTSATTSLLVQDSTGAETFRVNDGGNFGKVSPTSTGIFNIAGGSGSTSAAFFQNGLSNFNGFRIQMNAQTLIDEAGANAFVTSSAILELKATTKAFLPPRLTTTQRDNIPSPVAGLVLYDSTTNKLQCYNGSTWNDLF